ncbi:hypothetical protein EXN66_Car010602 [Channa argus]|uniref:Uncharacterized protein n=1 Tax=Channa argus TaxID=215402 RepID=A0A6G1PY84_CHAAH|nr:hypothetical protein EXN66_Car010602 [Channa argus]
MKDMEHKGPFCYYTNPLTSSLCSHYYPLFPKPFPLITGHRTQQAVSAHSWTSVHK